MWPGTITGAVCSYMDHPSFSPSDKQGNSQPQIWHANTVHEPSPFLLVPASFLHHKMEILVIQCTLRIGKKKKKKLKTEIPWEVLFKQRQTLAQCLGCLQLKSFYLYACLREIDRKHFKQLDRYSLDKHTFCLNWLPEVLVEFLACANLGLQPHHYH